VASNFNLKLVQVYNQKRREEKRREEKRTGEDRVHRFLKE
jgi:hypothetical protein